MVRRIDERLKGVEDALNVLIAGCDVLLGTIIALEGLGECKHMFGAVIARQRFRNGIRARLHARVAVLGEGPRRAFPRDNSADNAQPRHAGHITHHVVQMEMHLLQGLLPVLHVLDRHLKQIVAMAEETATPAQVLRRTK